MTEDELHDDVRIWKEVADARLEDIDRLRTTLKTIIDASKEFRDAMPKDWEGDPLQDAIDAAAALFAH